MTPTGQFHFAHRSCYVNFAEHLQNAWNPNVLYPGAPNRWAPAEWRAFFAMIRAFGYTHFEYWLPPTLFDHPTLAGDPVSRAVAAEMRAVTDWAHEAGLKTILLASPACIGAAWRFPCPNDPADRRLILDLWRHWTRALPETDMFSIFPGDPGGCNRNGCDHTTFIDLALEIAGVARDASPSCHIQIGTWGTPFTGWGDDLARIPGWTGDWKTLTDSSRWPAGTRCHIWNGGPARAERAMNDLLRRLPAFPAETVVALNLGFSPDGDATMGGDARAYAREIAKVRPIVTWDYSASEGELVCYPHWRLPRLAARRREERAAAPYSGGMCYTMSPKLNLLTLYAGGRLFADPDADPDAVSREFCARVFGAEHARLGELFEAFEIVPGWGHYPRRKWARAAVAAACTEMIDRLEAADPSAGDLPLFPDPEAHRQDLLWFARRFRELAGPSPDRDAIRTAYWDRALRIYDSIPQPADVRFEAARRFSEILSQEPSFFGS